MATARRTITPRTIDSCANSSPRLIAPFHSIAHQQTSQLSELSNSFSKGFIFICNAYFRHCSRNFFSDTQTGVKNYPADNLFLDKCTCLPPRELSSRELSLETNLCKVHFFCPQIESTPNCRKLKRINNWFLHMMFHSNKPFFI